MGKAWPKPRTNQWRKLQIKRRYLAALIAGFLLLGGLGYQLLAPDWPLRFTSPQWSTALFDRQGQLLDLHIAEDQQWRLPYQAVELPTRYQTALLAFEDQYFFQHPGINPLSVARAFWGNLVAGKVKSGASTITMQVSRLLYGNQPRTLTQKLQETRLAMQLEWHYEKPQILQLYANHAPYGGNIVGLTAASWWYFGREPAALSWAEAALLAVLPNSPGLIHPGRRADVLLHKRDQLLRKLAQRGAMQAVDLQLALLEPLPQKPAGWPAQSPHLLQTLRGKWPQQPLFYTDLDQQLQQQMTALLARHARTLAISGVHNSALLLIDHQEMKIRAYVGNASVAGETSTAEAANTTTHGRAVDIIQSRRSTGSILKPFLYALMLDEGLLTSESLLPDVPSKFGGYAPVNFDLQFRGAVKAGDALAQSLNVPAVRMLHQYGVGRFKQQLAAFGLSTVNKGADHYGLSLILGGAEATLFELSRSYAAMMQLAAQTNTTASLPLLSLQFPAVPAAAPHPDPKAETLSLPISSGAAYLTMQTLLNVERPDSEGSWRDYVNSQKIAWKTGTSFGLRDAWAIGSNGRYTIGVWTGNADGSPAAILAGARSAGPVLFDAFRLLPDAPWLNKPVTALQQVEVCANDGYRVRFSCPRSTTEMPAQRQLQTSHSFQQQLWLDPSGKFQLPAGCAPEVARQQQTRLILPVAMAYFYQPQHPEYQGLPPIWPGCEQMQEQSQTSAAPHNLRLDLLYPSSDSQIRLPLQLDGKLGQSIFRAVHRDNKALLYWHLDEQYLGQTRMPHQMAIQTTAGQHQLVITASDGSRLQRQFEVLGDPELKR
ncbi:penicillin-binding protein 1C [Rheinheimera riviphila]|uniref:penicillin-binding protein 1C n=1 Tax=Rheinheimera riviphila TaxID=1834037 RepID=UPI0019808738|nr:penicillin-binding protein 1C [Rheinheimera riviphila]